MRSSSGPEICAQSALERARGILDVFPSPLQGAMGQISQPEPMFSYLEAAFAGMLLLLAAAVLTAPT